MKLELIEHMTTMGVEVDNLGVDTEESMDYPDIAAAVGRAVAAGEADLGVVLCGTGIGVSISANKVPGVRAALCCYEYHARMAREHNFANVCCMGARVTGHELAKAILTAFIETPESEEERHHRRRRKMEALDNAR